MNSNLPQRIEQNNFPPYFCFRSLTKVLDVEDIDQSN
jgi:hypothetical protein